MRKNKKGFTLIELLVVIAIIGLLATIAVVALGTARKSSRDSKRIGDVKQIQTALELYYNAENSYVGCAADSQVNLMDACVGGVAFEANYMTGINNVKDPSSPAMDCTAANCDATSTDTCEYEYLDNDADTSSYNIYFYLESDSGSLLEGCQSANPSGIVHR